MFGKHYIDQGVVSRCCVWINSCVYGNKQGVTNNIIPHLGAISRLFGSWSSVSNTDHSGSRIFVYTVFLCFLNKNTISKTRWRPPHNRELVYDNRLRRALTAKKTSAGVHNRLWPFVERLRTVWECVNTAGLCVKTISETSLNGLKTCHAVIGPPQALSLSATIQWQPASKANTFLARCVPVVRRLVPFVPQARLPREDQTCLWVGQKELALILPWFEMSEAVENRQAVTHGRSRSGTDVPNRGKVVGPVVHGSSNRVQAVLNPRECKRGLKWT